MVVVVIHKDFLALGDGLDGANATNVSKARRECRAVFGILLLRMVGLVSKRGAVIPKLVKGRRHVDTVVAITRNRVCIVPPRAFVNHILIHEASIVEADEKICGHILFGKQSLRDCQAPRNAHQHCSPPPHQATSMVPQ